MTMICPHGVDTTPYTKIERGRFIAPGVTLLGLSCDDVTYNTVYPVCMPCVAERRAKLGEVRDEPGGPPLTRHQFRG